jgi:hypothetical protein
MHCLMLCTLISEFHTPGKRVISKADVSKRNALHYSGHNASSKKLTCDYPEGRCYHVGREVREIRINPK